MELFKLFGRVLVETSDADNSLDKTDAKSKSLTQSLGSYMQSAAKWASAIGAAVVAAGSAIAKVVADVAAQADEIDKQSQKIGLSAQAYQEWAYILEHNGTSIEAAGRAITDLSKKVGSGSEDVLEALERIGIGTNEALTATPEELWESVIRHLQEMEPGTERTAIATTLFGEAAKELGPLLNSSADDVQNLKDRVHELGGVMDDDLVKKGAEYEDAVTDLKTAWQGFKNDLATNTIPGMTESVNGLTQLLTGDFAGGLKTAGQGTVDFLDGCALTFYNFTTPIWESVASQIADFETWFANLFGVAGELNSIRQMESETGEPWWVTEGYNAPPDFDLHSQAIGLPFVPRDNYPANLHYGERVLTRQEAEEYNRGKGTGGAFSPVVNISTVSQSPAQTAAAVTAALEIARWSV